MFGFGKIFERKTEQPINQEPMAEAMDQSEAGAEQPLAPEAMQMVTKEVEALQSVQADKKNGALKAKLHRAAAIALASLSITAAMPSFAEAGSRHRNPGDAVESGVTYVIDSFFRASGQQVRDYQRDYERQRRAVETEARRQQRAAESEARRQQRAAETEARRQQRMAEQGQQEMQKKMDQALRNYNSQVANINRSYEQKKFGAIGSSEAEAARHDLMEKARESYLQQTIDLKGPGAQLTQEEMDYQAAKTAKENPAPSQTPAPENRTPEKGPGSSTI